MTTCEQFEEWLSAHLDGELDPQTALTALGHALECPSCAEFYRGAKRLAAAVDTAGEPVGAAPEEIWQRVRRAVGWRRSGGESVVWLWRAAAVLVIALGAWWLASGRVGEPVPSAATPGAEGTAAVAASASPQPMTDERFAQIAQEVLSADPRYRQALLGALETVSHRSDEANVDEYSVRSEGFRPLLGDAGRL